MVNNLQPTILVMLVYHLDIKLSAKNARLNYQFFAKHFSEKYYYC